ncbi:prepilin peptidase [Geosporobacter ferrireducens]|uniref:prepilin peptidase n=1 Tax=Geosporobacter ferrireducens TaxID=1424294 RepID=UPI0009F477F5|nr:A24 family peptidase [Geosporobacter ferrireducens]MTI54226.1 prepilin peptidase [Geosporobacter ferrireducens]
MNIIIFIYGLLIGSFLNVCIYRIPIEKSIIFPASHCPLCSTSLKPIDLIPVASYLSTAGKCRYCGEKISLRYPTFELITALIFSLLYYIFGLSVDFFVYTFIASLLIVVTGIDLDYQIIPDEIVLIGIGAAVIYILYSYFILKIPISLLSHLGGLLVGGGLFLLIAIASNGGMGGGDIKLMGMLGLWLGIKGILITTFLSFIIGAVISLILLATGQKTRKEAIPFGPFIAAAALITICFQEELLTWYIQRFIS